MDRDRTAAGCGRLTTGLAGGAIGIGIGLSLPASTQCIAKSLGDRAASIPSARRHAPPGRIAVTGSMCGCRGVTPRRKNSREFCQSMKASPTGFRLAAHFSGKDIAVADRALLERLSRALTEHGLLIEAGWVGYRLAVISPDAPAIQLEECKAGISSPALSICSPASSRSSIPVKNRPMRISTRWT